MKKIQILGLALAALFALSAVMATMASAETTLLAEWLFNGAAVTAALPVETTGELTLTSLLLGVVGAAIKCAGIFDGTVNANGAGQVTALLNVAKEEIGKELVGLELICLVTVAGACGAVNAEARLWTDQLPWNTTLELMEAGAILNHFLSATAGYHVFCPTVMPVFEDLCFGLTSATMTNGATDVIGKFDTTSEAAKCSTGAEGMITGEGLTVDTAGGTLAVSSE